MSEASAPPKGPDLTQGCESSQIPEDGSLLGHAHGEAVGPPALNPLERGDQAGLEALLASLRA